MCGINGLYAYNRASPTPLEAELLATRDHMARRGPDGAGAWWSSDRRLALGHRRLAIIDLDARAAQPMLSHDGAMVVTFNGEIYNLPELRAGLEAQGRQFRTTSDTEALLHLYAVYGPAMVRMLRGMFAFGIWDATRNGLFLARDPYGIKPLYTANDGWTFRFASQVKALLAGGKVSRDPEPAGLVGFHLFGSVPEPFTLYREIRALPAGHTQWIDAAGPGEPQAYANLAEALSVGARNPAPASERRARIGAAVADSVRAHLLADVEVGVFLSAGVDSGALLGLMRDAGQAKVRTITLGFGEFLGAAEDEVPLAIQVAALYGAEHIVRRVSEAEFRADLPDIIDAMDQPSIDGVNTWFVAKAAREAGLKVALSGLGGDELLAGYPSFRDIPRWVSWLRGPGAVPGLGAGLRALGVFAGLSRDNPKALGLAEYGGSYPGAYLLRRGLFLPFELPVLLDRDLVAEGLRRLRPLGRLGACLAPDPGSPTARVSALESANYMKNQLLRDADWAGMAHSLEIRTPLVDFTLLQALAPISRGLTAAEGKGALAAAPSIPLPAAIVQRPKTGFGVPTGRWMAQASGASGPRRTTTAPRKGAASRAWGLEVLTAQQARAASVG
jgi:asparagine synthase (glutamine-hydrolysing)